MTQPLPEGRLPELDSSVACVGINGFYSFRLRCWQGGEEGNAAFLEIPLLLDPLEVERVVDMPRAPKFWEAFDLAHAQASPDQREFMESTTPVHGSMVRECGRTEHDDGNVRYSASPRFEAGGRWAVAERLGGLAVMSFAPSRALIINDQGIGEASLLYEGEETVVTVIAGDVTPDEWFRTRRSLGSEGDPPVLLAQSIVGSHVQIVLNPLPIQVPHPDSAQGTVERLVNIRGSEDLRA